MTDEIAIAVSRVTKAYRIWDRPSSRLVSPLLQLAAEILPSSLASTAADRARRRYRDFFALNNISFDLRRGEALGIIGRNGSGKSTLLQILAGTLQPTSGNIRVNGRVAALLELGSGFNPEFTGRENVMLNGAILGIARNEMDALFPTIADFAEIGDFIEEPVKTYSSGMMVRLAFAVAVSIRPDLLIVDEALSVGDFFFSQKCFIRIREILAQGATLIFVTHDTASVVSLCRRALWLDHGIIREAGSADDVVRSYLVSAGSGKHGLNANGGRYTQQSTSIEPPNFAPVDMSGCARLGNQQAQISAVWNVLNTGREIAVCTGDWVEFRLAMTAKADLVDVSAGFEVWDRLGQIIHATGLRATGNLIPSLGNGETVLVRIRFMCILAPGKYRIDVGCGDSNDEQNSSERVIGALILNVKPPATGEIVHGLVQLPSRIEVGSLASRTVSTV